MHERRKVETRALMRLHLDPNTHSHNLALVFEVPGRADDYHTCWQPFQVASSVCSHSMQFNSMFTGQYNGIFSSF